MLESAWTRGSGKHQAGLREIGPISLRRYKTGIEAVRVIDL